MKSTVWADAIAYLFIILFLYTGIVKLTEIHLFKEQLISSPLLSSMAGFVAWALPFGEILLAVLLFLPDWRLKGLYATLAVMILFTIYVTIILFMDDHLSCSCGGIIEDLTPRQHVFFNVACSILAGLAIFVLRRPNANARSRWLTGSSVVCLLGMVGWTLFSAFTAPAQIRTGMEGRPLPSFDLLLTDSVTHLNTADIPTGTQLVVVGFSPACTHCQAEVRDITSHIGEFPDVRFLFVTPFPFDQMKLFYRYFKLAKYPSITMGRDDADAFLKYFKAPGVPYTAIFDAKKRLKTSFANGTDAAQIAKALAQ